MDINYLVQQSFFVIRFRYLKKWKSSFNMIWLRLAGMKIGKGTFLTNCIITWPQQVSLGKNCSIEHGVHFKFDGVWTAKTSIIIEDNVFLGSGVEFNIRQQIIIKTNSLIASGCKFIDHDHGVQTDDLIRNQLGPEKGIFIGSDVWLGCNVVVLKGITIGNGSIVAAGAVVNKSIPAYEIWGGIPAKKIGERK